MIVAQPLSFLTGKLSLKVAPEMKTLVLSGSKKERSGQLADLTEIDVVITSYDLLKRDIANYEPHTLPMKYR